MPDDSPSWKLEPLLLIEVGLALLLFGLAVALFFVPAAQPSFVPYWWAWILLAGLFFGIVGLETYRRRHRSREELRRVMDDADREVRRDRPG